MRLTHQSAFEHAVEALGNEEYKDEIRALYAAECGLCNSLKLLHQAVANKDITTLLKINIPKFDPLVLSDQKYFEAETILLEYSRQEVEKLFLKGNGPHTSEMFNLLKEVLAWPRVFECTLDATPYFYEAGNKLDVLQMGARLYRDVARVGYKNAKLRLGMWIRDCLTKIIVTDPSRSTPLLYDAFLIIWELRDVDRELCNLCVDKMILLLGGIPMVQWIMSLPCDSEVGDTGTRTYHYDVRKYILMRMLIRLTKRFENTSKEEMGDTALKAVEEQLDVLLQISFRTFPGVFRGALRMRIDLLKYVDNTTPQSFSNSFNPSE